MDACGCKYWTFNLSHLDLLLTELSQANDNVVALNTPGYTVEVLWTKVATGTSNSFPKVLESGSEPLTHVVMEKVGVV